MIEEIRSDARRPVCTSCGRVNKTRQIFYLYRFGTAPPKDVRLCRECRGELGMLILGKQLNDLASRYLHAERQRMDAMMTASWERSGRLIKRIAELRQYIAKRLS